LSARIDEAGFVREHYATEHNLAARKSAYANKEGDDPREFAVHAVAEVKPQRVLEVGGGEGELAEWITAETGAEILGIDQSERMVEIQRSKGIEATVGDVQELPFADGGFDAAVAAWMLYHVPDLDRGLGELARVLKRGGRLVAVTNSVEHLRELWDLAGRDTAVRRFTFRSENGEETLRRHFARVERRDASGWVTMDDATMRRFAASWEDLHPILDLPPLEAPLRARCRSTVFVAETPDRTL
jgi:SAM-dependent methyltransferase